MESLSVLRRNENVAFKTPDAYQYQATVPRKAGFGEIATVADKSTYDVVIKINDITYFMKGQPLEP
ncbi:MAG: hypothetical protein AABY74_05030 [Planctomycetota bacterium]